MSDALRLDFTVAGGPFEVSIAWQTEQRFVGLFGPSGAGKTTVLEALAGLRRGVRGRIEVGGRTWLDSERGIRLEPERRGVGYVPQEMLLFPHLDVLGNLRMGERRAASASTRLTAEHVLEFLELGPLAHRAVAQLSGGERQRVALGRALCSAPELLLLDEPLASLDRPLRRRILPYLLRVRDEFGIPTVYVSHDASEVTLLCEEVCVLDRGRVVATGRPEEVLLGSDWGDSGEGKGGPVNVLRGLVAEVADSLAFVEIESGLRIAIADLGGVRSGQRVAFELRASDILLARGPSTGLSAQNVLAATIREVHVLKADDPHAAAAVFTVLGSPGNLGITAVVSRAACRQLELAAGGEITLIFKAQACRLLAAY